MSSQGDFFETVAYAREKLFADMRAKEKRHCPCCGHYCQYYKRKLHRVMALDVIWLYRQHQKTPWEFVRVQNRKLGGRQYSADTGDLGKLKHWQLVEQMPNLNEDKKTSGYWRITMRGIAFAQKQITVPKYALLYLDEVIEFSEERITLADALPDWFSYRELMNPSDDGWPPHWE